MLYWRLIFGRGVPMGLMTGSIACTRFSVVSAPEELDFEAVPFRALQAGSNIRESTGFIPYEPGADYQIANRQWAFRIRLDQKKVDRNQHQERLRELIKIEHEQVGPPSIKKIQELRKLAEEELLATQSSTTQIIECLIDDATLYVGTVSQTKLGLVSAMLLKLGVQIDFKTPWLELGMESAASQVIDYKDGSQSVLGCDFLKWLLNDPEFFPEIEQGQGKLITDEGTTVTLKGTIQNDLDRYLDSGADLLTLKLIYNDVVLTLDGLSFRISGLKVNPYKSQHWIETLQSRMERVGDLWQTLDDRFQAFADQRV